MRELCIVYVPTRYSYTRLTTENISPHHLTTSLLLSLHIFISPGTAAGGF